MFMFDFKLTQVCKYMVLQVLFRFNQRYIKLSRYAARCIKVRGSAMRYIK